MDMGVPGEGEAEAGELGGLGQAAWLDVSGQPLDHRRQP